MSARFRDFLPDYTFLFSIAGVVLVIDQLTKWLVRDNIPFRQTWMPIEWLAPYVRIVNWHNTGAAFGMFRDGGTLFAVLAVIVGLAIVVYYPIVPRSDKFLRVALALQFAGALGNLIDRLTVGAVTDFISIWTFPVFNVADASISTGVVLLLWPYVTQFSREYAHMRTMQKAKQLNTSGRPAISSPIPKNKPSEDESVPLGILEVLLQETPPIREFILAQRAKRIRHRYAHRRQPPPGRERQPGMQHLNHHE